MRIHFQDVSGECASAVEAMKTGKHVILTENRVPVALIQALRPATEAEEHAILEMIRSGVLQPGRKSGSIREWKWRSKPARSRAA
jgi:antitoxin (DNA-binding transcriptional repressor) of toxin-antitoxin stability system